MKKYDVNWDDRVSRTMTIKANSKEEAYEIWSKGEYDFAKEVSETDASTISSKEEIIEDMTEYENQQR